MRRLVLTCFAATVAWLAPSAPASAWQSAVREQATLASPITALIDQAKGAMMANPAEALTHIAAAEALLNTNVNGGEVDTELATVWWLESEALARLGRPLEAKPVALRALAQLGAEPERTKLYADILVSLGRVNKVTGEYGLSFENFQHAYRIYQEIGDRRSESIVLQSIGSIYTDAHQYQRAVEYYDNASNRYHGDRALELSANNNLGNAYRQLGQYNEALEHFERARVLAAEMESGSLQARILNNIAALHIAFGEFDAAAQAIDMAFAEIDDPVHSEWARFLWGARARIAYGRGDYRAAAADIGRTFDGISLDATTQSFVDYHAAAADIYQALTLWDLAVPHLRAFKRLDDEGRDVAASANTSLLAAQFDFAEQELQIEQLRTNSLEQNLELTNARARQRMIGLSSLLALSFLGLFLIYIRHRTSREQQRVLEKALYVDLDTGLPSRAATERAIGERTERECRPVTLVALGIERHKHLENALGFVKSSQLKTVMAERITAQVEVDLVTSLAPDILGVLLAISDADAALPVAEQMRQCFNTPVMLDGIEIDVAVTAGLYAGTTAETCVKNAVIALDQARESCSATAVFDAVRFGDPEQNLTLMSRMLAATRNGDMVMHYQPKLHLPSGCYLAAEALCRWSDSEHGAMPPDAFIPLAEETGHIREFTKWSLEQVVRDQHALRAAGHDIMLAVNISGSLISDTEFAELALRIALQAPGRISFEVTETAAMQNAERALANLEKWAAADIKLAIDDYGTGLSSLAYLKTLPSHELKLDRAFVTHMASSQRDRMLVKSTSDLAHGLGLEMTAEGVETPEALALLKLIGCDWAQGFALSKAVPLAELSEFLIANPEMKNLPSVPKRTKRSAR